MTTTSTARLKGTEAEGTVAMVAAPWHPRTGTRASPSLGARRAAARLVARWAVAGLGARQESPVPAGGTVARLGAKAAACPERRKRRAAPAGAWRARAPWRPPGPARAPRAPRLAPGRAPAPAPGQARGPALGRGLGRAPGRQRGVPASRPSPGSSRSRKKTTSWSFSSSHITSRPSAASRARRLSSRTDSKFTLVFKLRHTSLCDSLNLPSSFQHAT